MEGFLLKGLLSLVILSNVIFPPGTSPIPSNIRDVNPFNTFLSGTSSGPDIAVSRFDLRFGTVPIHTPSLPLVVTVANTGDEGLEITGVNITGTWDYAFSIVSDNASGQTLTPGESANISVTFNPIETGPQGASLRITSNDPDENPVNVRLYGTGVEYGIIHGTVYDDTNCNGVQDPGEPGIVGVTVTLDGTTTDITDANGYYSRNAS